MMNAEARRVRGPTVREGSSKCGVRNSECGIPVQKPDRKGGRYSVTVTSDEGRAANLESEIRHAEARRVRGPTVREGSSKCGVRSAEFGMRNPSAEARP